MKLESFYDFLKYKLLAKVEKHTKRILYVEPVEDKKHVFFEKMDYVSLEEDDFPSFTIPKDRDLTLLDLVNFFNEHNIPLDTLSFPHYTDATLVINKDSLNEKYEEFFSLVLNEEEKFLKDRINREEEANKERSERIEYIKEIKENQKEILSKLNL